MDNRFLIPAVLFILCLAIRSAYELLKEARKINPESKPIFAFVFASMCVLWVSWFSLCPMDPFRVEFPGAVRWIDHLATSGLFTKIRHPM